MSEAINVPVLGIIETWRISQKNYQKINITFWKEGARNLSEDLDVAFLGECR
jgi:ATP-binding protein involved in chromosome partitioning